MQCTLPNNTDFKFHEVIGVMHPNQIPPPTRWSVPGTCSTHSSCAGASAHPDYSTPMVPFPSSALLTESSTLSLHPNGRHSHSLDIHDGGASTSSPQFNILFNQLLFSPSSHMLWDLVSIHTSTDQLVGHPDDHLSFPSSSWHTSASTSDFHGMDLIMAAGLADKVDPLFASAIYPSQLPQAHMISSVNSSTDWT